MFGSIHIGLSGLGAYSRGLQQVSNNVTNLNSSGFKGSTVTFTDLVSINGNGGLSYSGSQRQGGNGVNIGSPQIDFRQGDLRQTDRDLDLAIDGSGFMILMKGEQLLYTRTGSFEVDRDGYIVLAGTDYRLATLDSAGRPVSLSVDLSRTSPPQRTSTIRFADNLSSTSSGFSVSDIRVYDQNGGEHVWQVRFEKAEGVPGEWNVTVSDGTGRTVGTQVLRFIQGIVDPQTQFLSFGDEEGAAATLDFSGGVTSFSSGEVSTLRAASVDGYRVGAITAIRVNAEGKIEISYSNEQKKQLGPVAIADFRDPQTLEQRSGGLFADSGRSQRQLLTSEDSRIGRVVSRRLESSNVDLAKQFGELILIQRGFQASSQIISVSNDMIQQLFGIRGQG